MTIPESDFFESNLGLFESDGFAALKDAFDPGCVWHACGRRLPEPLNGWDEILRWQAAKHTGPDYSIRVHDTLTSDDHVVVLYEEEATRGDRTETFQGVYVMHMNGDGKISEVWNVPADQYAYDDFYAPESGG